MQAIKVNKTKFGIALIVYCILVFVTVFLVQYMQSPWRYLVAFLPTIPTIFAMHYFMNWMRASDELVRLQALEAVAFGAMVSMVIFITWSFLEAAGAPVMRAPIATAVIMSGFALGTLVPGLRYQ